MLSEAFSEGKNGIVINYRTDGKLFNLRRLKSKSKVEKETVQDMLFADDCALCTSSESDMQSAMDNFSSACSAFGLTISTKKTEVLYQPADKEDLNEPTITVNNELLKSVETFTYLGSTLSKDARIDAEVDKRIAKASTAFGRLRSNVWERKGLTLKTKLKVYKAVVLPSLLYSCEAWTVYQQHARKLNRFHLNALRRILNIRWQDRIPDTDVLDTADMPSVHTILKKNQLRWAGHVVRMNDYRLPKQMFYSELSTGRRSAGGQYKRYKDTLKASLKSFNIPTDTWEAAAGDRTEWRGLVRKGATHYEHERTLTAQNKRRIRKERMNSCVPPTATDHICPTCGRAFLARIGLTSHQRVHKPK